MRIVVLAAGKARRFGGNKQQAAVDTRGQCLLEYTLYDARKAGVEEAVLIVRQEEIPSWKQGVGARLARCMKVSYCPQIAPEAYGYEHRTLPLGTGHALLCASAYLDQPAILCNADDFYGRESIERAVSAAIQGVGCVVGFAVGSTVPEGQVNRALIAHKGTRISALVECAVWREEGDLWAADQSCRRRIQESLPASMNLMSLTPAVRPILGRGFAQFLQKADTAEEYPLTHAINQWVAQEPHGVRLEIAKEQWCGLTHAEDLVGVRRRLAALVLSGQYPLHLHEA